MTRRLLRALALIVPLLLASSAGAQGKKTKEHAGKKEHAPKKERAPKRGHGAKPGAARLAAAPPAARPAAAARAAEAPPPPALAVEIQRATLDNGLRVVVHPDHAAPTVAVAVTYDAGSREDDRGRGGLAHLVEHMMFDGSANVARGEHVRLVAARGGTTDATTTVDRTSFFEELPSGELALALWLEADRMKSLEIDADRYESSRRTIDDELRARAAGVPYAGGQARLRELVFQGSWAWEHDPMGAPAELAGTPLDTVRAFWKAHYAPNRAVLSIVGDVDADEAMDLVHHFFDTARRDERSASPAASSPPDQTGPRGAAVDDVAARTPGAFWGWLGPETRTAGHDAIALALAVLGDGAGSRLHQRLVRERGLARSVAAWTDEQRGPDLLGLHVELADGAKLADVEKIIDAEIDALGKQPPTSAELDRARAAGRTALLAGVEPFAARAVRLGEWELVWGDARKLAAAAARPWQVEPEEVRQAVVRWLGPARRSRVEVRPPGVTLAVAPARPARPAPQAAPPAKGKGATKAAKPAKGGKKGKK